MEKEIALVTGGGTGIGQAICEELANSNRYIYIHYGGSEEGAKETLSLVEAKGGLGEIIQADLNQSEQISAMIQKIKDQSGRLDILVNNAGITKDGLAVRMSDDMYDAVIRVNQKAVFVAMREAGKLMMRQRKGKIINISSVVGLHGNAGQINYAAAKSAVFAMSKSLAQELATRNVTVNCVAPGYIDTAMTEELPDQVKQAIINQIPMQRTGSPQEIAYAVKFLASKEADYITGQSISVDGGMNM
ncbi:MAG: 3-oxoacyl-[acyl-carrier-protein] reductase [Clostridiaceae bacterium]|jgi:3-oxoacyl-[acyl-carrier protein] reductase|nr:3-oxoacyl-[acyl-carrier-protein] reductase [Bacillota bacterium]NLN51970.1 3-oxoacyl-[acyl-carrier-protein] reductase [Clostridiaceae bacterium]